MHHRVATLLAGIIGLEALVVMTGWILNIDALTRILPGGINMKFPTALMFLFAAGGLYYISRIINDEDDRVIVFLPGVALTLAILTSIMLIGRTLGIPTGIETIFITQPDSLTTANRIPINGLPSIPALLDFMLFAIASVVATFATMFRTRFLRIIGSIIIATASVAIAGYALDIPALYFEFAWTAVPIAFNTALCFFLLGTGLILATSTEKKQ